MEHTPAIKRLAAHKKEIEVPPPYREKKPLQAFKRIIKLNVPKKYPLDEKTEWKFTEDMKNYKPSDRLKIIAAHKPIEDDIHIRKLPIEIPKSALKYKATERTKTLSTQAKKKGAVSDLKDKPFEVSENAKKAKASARTKELAEPKEYEEIKERSQQVSEAAKKAKASPRTIELAKEKFRTEKYVSPNKR